MKNLSTKNMVRIAILGCLAYLLMLIKFPLPFMPPFMDFDLSGVPTLIGTFAIGPLAGVFIAVIKITLKLVSTGTLSMLTGEIQNLILGCAYILPAGFIYQKYRTKKSALIGLIVSTIVCAIVAVFSNMYVIIPFYAKAFNLSMAKIIDMTRRVNPLVDSELKFILLGIIPFNLIKHAITSVIVYLIYPIILPIIKKEEKNAVSKSSRTTI